MVASRNTMTAENALAETKREIQLQQEQSRRNQRRGEPIADYGGIQWNVRLVVQDSAHVCQLGYCLDNEL